MADPVGILLQLGVVLLAGILLSVLCKWLRVPELLIFILFGFGLGQLWFRGGRVFDFSIGFVTTISLLALSLFVFEGSAGFRIGDVTALGAKAFKLIGWSLLVHLPLFTVATMALGVPFWLAFIFAGIMLGTGELVVLPMLGATKGWVFDLLKMESLLNTPVNVILPFLALDLMRVQDGSGPVDAVLSQFQPFLLKLFVGIGVGIVAGIVLFKVLRSVYEEVHSPLAMLTASILAYALSETLGGSGVLAVTFLGFIFGNVYLEEQVRGKLMEVESVFSRSLYILLFVTFGSILQVQYTWWFLLSGLGLLLVYLCARYLIVTLAIKPSTPLRTRMFMTLMSPNGAPAIAVAAFLGGLAIPGAQLIVALTGLVIVLQILVASIAVRFRDSLLPPEAPAALAARLKKAPKTA